MDKNQNYYCLFIRAILCNDFRSVRISVELRKVWWATHTNVTFLLLVPASATVSHFNLLGPKNYLTISCVSFTKHPAPECWSTVSGDGTQSDLFKCCLLSAAVCVVIHWKSRKVHNVALSKKSQQEFLRMLFIKKSIVCKDRAESVNDACRSFRS